MNKTDHPRCRPVMTFMLAGLGFVAGVIPFVLRAETNDFPPDMVRGEGPPPRHDRPDAGPPMQGAHPILLLLDRDDDQIVSAAEIAAAGARLMEYDENGDGALSENEILRAMPPPGPPPGGPQRGRERRGPPPGADF